MSVVSSNVMALGAIVTCACGVISYYIHLLYQKGTADLKPADIYFMRGQAFLLE